VASLSPVLRAVRAAGESALRQRARPWEIGEADWFTGVERLRALAGRLFGDDAEGVALVPATSYGFAVAAANLPLDAGQQILVLADEYPSGIYTWRRLAERTKGATEEIAATIRSIQEETRSTLEVMRDSRAAVETGMGETDRARKSLEATIDSSKQVEHQIHLIATAATQQTSASCEISESASQISQLSIENAQGAQEAVEALKNLASLAADLDGMIRQFTLDNNNQSEKILSGRAQTAFQPQRIVHA